MRRRQNILKQQMLLWICCFSFFIVKAQPQYLSEKAEISVLTCGTGAELYSLFGHTALRVKDIEQQIDVVYNWGMFDFKTEGFYSKFVKGDLMYYLDVDRFNDFIYHYTLDNREVVEQQLDLTYEQKLRIWEEINQQLQSERRFYTYEFIKNNCTTKVVDVLNGVLEEVLPVDFPSNQHSYRFILNEGLDRHYFEKLGINLLFGASTNKDNELIFLPIKLKDALAYNQKYIKSQKVINKVDVLPSKWWNSIYFLWGLVLILTMGSRFKKGLWIYFLLTAILSVFLFTIGFYTHHVELRHNILILFFNPFYLLFFYIKLRKIFFAALILSLISLILMGWELFYVLSPLVVLHGVYIMALFLMQIKKNNREGCLTFLKRPRYD